MERKESLSEQVNKCSEHLDRAQRMLRGLGGEMTRWQEEIVVLRDTTSKIVGSIHSLFVLLFDYYFFDSMEDMLAAAVQMTYLGPFNPSYRQKLISLVTNQLVSAKIPHSDSLFLSNLFHDQLEEGLWVKHQLPQDSTSRDNAMMVLKASPFPIIIDPQGQASRYCFKTIKPSIRLPFNRWLKSLLLQNKLTITKPNDEDLLRKLENAIQFGTPILLEDVVAENLNPAVLSLLASISSHHIASLSPSPALASAKHLVRVGDTLFACAEGFRLYITTQHPFPHFPPDATARGTLIDFTLTPEGLEEQLLGLGVARIHAEVEAQRERFATQAHAHTQKLIEVEDKMLMSLTSAGVRFLEDDALVQSLAKSKASARELTQQLAEVAQNTRKLNALRAVYLPLASRGVTLFFILADLHRLDPMYHYSLSYFTYLFQHSIDEEIRRCAEREGWDLDLPLNPSQVPLDDLISHFTFVVYTNISQSLMENHKQLFGFVVCSRLLLQTNELLPSHWQFMLTGMI